MKPFITNRSFTEQTFRDGKSLWHRVEIRIRAVLSEPALPPEPNVAPQNFIFDTGSDYLFVPRATLSACQIPVVGPATEKVYVTLADGSQTEQFTRDVDLWLYGDDPSQLYRIELRHGVIVFPNPHSQADADTRSLLGMNALLDGRLRVELDAETRKFSIWVPE